MLRKEEIKRVAYFIGKSLGILGLMFVFYRLSQEFTLSDFKEKFFLLIHIVPALIVLNFISVPLGVYGWHMMLLHYAERHFPYSVSYYFFAKTEIAKYLPGNVFHFVGRQLLAKKINLSQTQMMKVTGLYTFLLLIGTIISGAFFSIFGSGSYPQLIILLFLSILISVTVSLFIFPSFPRSKKLQMDLILAVSIGLQGIMMGIIVFSQLNNWETGLFFQVAGIYIFSWLVGFVTPGASGGIGVREGAFIAISEYIHLEISSEIIIFSILFIRIINIMADVLAYGTTYIIAHLVKHDSLL